MKTKTLLRLPFNKFAKSEFNSKNKREITNINESY